MGSITQRITLLSDGKGNHLQAGLGEHVSDTLGVMLHGQTHCQGGDDLFINAAVGIHGNADGQVIVRTEALGDDFIIVALAAYDTGFHVALLDQLLGNGAGKNSENIAGTKVQPLRLYHGIEGDLLRIVLRQVIALPGFNIFYRL